MNAIVALYLPISMTKKNPLISILAPLVVIALILIVVFAVQPSAPSAPGERVSSDNGAAEAQAYLNALAEGNWADAAQYAQEGCTEDCLFAESSATEIATYLEEACNNGHYCGPARLDLADEQERPRRTHTMQEIDANGEMQRFCLDETCGIQKSKYIISTVEVEGTWYVTELPAAYAGFPQ